MSDPNQQPTTTTNQPGPQDQQDQQVPEPQAPLNPASFQEPQPEVAAPDDTVVYEYNPTGDPALDLALNFVGGLGFGPDSPAIKAAEKGDFAPIEAALKALGDKAKGHERYVAAAKASYEKAAARNKQQEEATVKAIYEAAGGEKNWNAVHAWVAAEATPEQKQQIEAAFRAGELPAAAMARQLAELYKQSGKSKLPPKAVASPNAGAASAPTGGALSPAEYRAEIRRLEAKYGNRLQETQEYADVTARRLAFRN